MKRDIKQAIMGFLIVAFNSAALIVMNEMSKDFFREPSRDTFIPFLLTACIWFFTVLICLIFEIRR